MLLTAIRLLCSSLISLLRLIGMTMPVRRFRGRYANYLGSVGLQKVSAHPNSAADGLTEHRDGCTLRLSHGQKRGNQKLQGRQDDVQPKRCFRVQSHYATTGAGIAFNVATTALTQFVRTTASIVMPCDLK